MSVMTEHFESRATLDSPKLLVIVFIDYALPEALPGRWLGRAFGRVYARWCTERMVSDAVRHFTTHKERE